MLLRRNFTALLLQFRDRDDRPWRNFFKNGNEETSAVTVIRHQSHAEFQRKGVVWNGEERRVERRRRIRGRSLGGDGAVIFHDVPGLHAGVALQSGKRGAGVDELECAVGAKQDLRDDGFVFDGVQGASGVDEAAADFEEMRTAEGDLDLGLLKARCVEWAPGAKEGRSLAKSAITRAHDVAKNFVEEFSFRTVVIVVVAFSCHVGHESCVVIGEDGEGKQGADSLALMNQHVGTFFVKFIRNNKTLRSDVIEWKWS